MGEEEDVRGEGEEGDEEDEEDEGEDGGEAKEVEEVGESDKLDRFNLRDDSASTKNNDAVRTVTSKKRKSRDWTYKPRLLTSKNFYHLSEAYIEDSTYCELISTGAKRSSDVIWVNLPTVYDIKNSYTAYGNEVSFGPPGPQ